jgi:DNA-binding transcriptional MocR family regulator
MSGNRARSEQTLVEACVQWATIRIDAQVFRPGMRLPSIRALARQQRVSPFTVVEAYGRLVASGYLEARQGSGFYVRRRTGPRLPARDRCSPIDLRWLLRHMLDSSSARGPGLGVLPASWLDGVQLGAALRSLGRQSPGRWLDSGKPQGFEPLRAVLQQRLAQLDVLAYPDQIVLTTGVTHALDLVLRAMVSPGDAVLVLDPSWFGALGMLAARGVRALGVPCTARGPDLAALERLAREEQPRLLILSSAAQNPTGLSLSREAAARILDVAARFDLQVFEDDVYADLCAAPIGRLAAADQLDRVIYAASFSKTLAANIRVGFLACRSDLALSLADAKILSGFTTPELNERVVHKLLVEGRYTRHVEALRARLGEHRTAARTALERAGFEIFGDPAEGMFLWVNTRTDTNELAVACRDEGLLLAPGSLFSPQQTPSNWMRFNVTAPLDEAMAALLRSVRRSRHRVT